MDTATRIVPAVHQCMVCRGDLDPDDHYALPVWWRSHRVGSVHTTLCAYELRQRITGAASSNALTAKLLMGQLQVLAHGEAPE